jgi:hypothetical protein
MSEGSTVKKARLKKEKPPLELLSPQPMPEIHRWLIFGLDPSLSRTGYALMEVNRDATAPPARWITVGSVKPESAADPVWLRSKLLALSLRDILREHTPQDQYTGLIISAEAPTAQNDFLVTLNRVLHVILFEGDLADQYAFTGVLQTNASTLRSLMGLKMRGAKNKTENIAKAYSYLDQGTYPNLDTDACDAVLLSMMGRYTASLLLGFPTTLTNAAKEVKGKGRNARVITKGILHRSEYWYAYRRSEYAVVLRDARVKTRLLNRRHYTI